ncbi:MAG: type IV pilus biogenesis/stability protein PilW [Woeseiaceae bacterium]|nr:type IV pilus biogenesis/stability protein PilW [Woeseiaceae bacterium]
MKYGNLSMTGAICFFLMAGCVSCSTGSITEPVRNDVAAAATNYQLGARYYQQGSYDLARDRLMTAIEIDPNMADAYTTLALTYEALDKPRLAREAYENAIRVEPKDFLVQNTYAVFLCRQKEYDLAKKYFDKAASHPENDNAEVTLTNAGVCMGQKPDVEAAEAFFRQALQVRPNYAEALLQICLLKYQDKDYLGARAFLQRYMSISVPSAGILYLASKIEDLLGNARGRTEFEDQLIRDFPSSPEARKVLGAG